MNEEHRDQPDASGTEADAPANTQHVQEQHQHVKRLHRSDDQRMLLGVCGGLADYFDVDPTIIRIIFVVLAVVGGSGILIYAALAIIMPASDKLEIHPREAARATVDEAVDGTKQAVGQANTWVREKTGRSSKPDDTATPH